MHATQLGRTLVIANPASHGGRGRKGAQVVCEQLEKRGARFELALTQAPGEASVLAREASGAFHTVLVAGGDGIVHEAVGGLMELPRKERPALGVIPLGSGNDYARTLGIPRNSPRLAVDACLEGRARHVEVGCVNDTWFAQTLSFGLDAAVALEARERHAEGVGNGGSGHYVDSAARIFAQGQQGWAWSGAIDGEPRQTGRALIFAVQVGPTYGGGFAIAPGANPSDGMLDLCYSLGQPSVPHLLGLLGLARFGLHTGSPHALLRYARELTLDFEDEPPVQADGEPLRGTHFDIRVEPRALVVLAGRRVRW